MGTFDGILRCNVGTAWLTLLGYTKDAEPVLDAGGARTATKVRFTCAGEIEAADAAALPAALAAFAADANTDGRDFVITAHNVERERLDAADCLAGPTVRYAYTDEQGHNLQGVQLTVEATVAAAGSGGVLSGRESTRVAVNLEGLQTVTISGTVQTTGDPAASVVVLTGTGEPPEPRIPARPAGWQQTHSYEIEPGDTECRYEVTQTQLVNAYPVNGINPADRVVDGEETITTEYDAHNRAVTVYAYTYTGTYAEGYLDAMHATLRAAGGLQRASLAVTHHKTRQASGTFHVLAGRAGDLLELTETISHARSGPLLAELRYPGTTPIVYQAATPGYVYQQSGRAVGRSRYPQPPPYKFAAANLSEPPEVVLTRASDCEWETSWRFTFLFATEQATQAPSSRADSPGFF